MQRGPTQANTHLPICQPFYPMHHLEQGFQTRVLAANGKLVSLLCQGQEIPGQAMQPAQGRQFSLATAGLSAAPHAS